MIAKLAYSATLATHGMSDSTSYKVMLGVIESKSDRLQLKRIENIFEEDYVAIDAEPTSGTSHQPEVEPTRQPREHLYGVVHEYIFNGLLIKPLVQNIVMTCVKEVHIVGVNDIRAICNG